VELADGGAVGIELAAPAEDEHVEVVGLLDALQEGAELLDVGLQLEADLAELERQDLGDLHADRVVVRVEAERLAEVEAGLLEQLRASSGS
jgi:hypothetical protein